MVAKLRVWDLSVGSQKLCFPLTHNKAFIVLSPVGFFLEWFKYRMFAFVCMRPWLLVEGQRIVLSWVFSS